MTISLPWVAQLLFIAIRFSTLLLFTPIQAIRQLPIPMRLILIFSLSLLVQLNTPGTTPSDYLLLRCLSEFANGLILATSLYAAFSIYQIAGQLIDNQTGLNSLTLFKPDEPGQEPLSARLLSMLAVLFFLGGHGAVWLFKGLSYSFVIIPPGAMLLLNGFKPLINQFSFMFSMSFIIASPMIIALVTIDFCSALITRTMPQVNTYFFTLPIKIILGLAMLSMMLPYLAPITDRIMEECFHTWQEFMV